jgi:hypothetical protein
MLKRQYFPRPVDLARPVPFTKRSNGFALYFMRPSGQLVTSDTIKFQLSWRLMTATPTRSGIWTGSDTNPHQHFHFSPGDDTAIFSGNNRDDQYFATLMTTVTLTASENQILVFCSPGGGSGTANGQIIAMAVDAIN